MIDNILNTYIAAFLTMLSAWILGADISASWIFAPVVAFVATCAIVDVLGFILARHIKCEEAEEESTDDDSEGTA